MKFGPVPIENAVGKVLGHNIYAPNGRRVFQKGKAIRADDLPRLEALGRQVVYVAEIEAGDIGEDQAALRIAQVVTGGGIRLSKPTAGRVNLLASLAGVLRVDAVRLELINFFEGITLATLSGDQFVHSGQILATVKIIPFAIPGALLEQAESVGQGDKPLVWVEPLLPKRVGLILSGSTAAQARLRQGFEEPLSARVSRYGSRVDMIEYLPLEEESDEISLTEVLNAFMAQGMELLILAGDTAILDRCDIAPRAVVRAGGTIECVGVPVDPGNLLMLGYIGEVPVLGAPGCARSMKTNAIDWVLPRILVGEHLGRKDLARLGFGGLLEDTNQRPLPRSRVALRD